MYNGRKGCALDDTKEVPRAGAVETRAAVISGCVACSWPPRDARYLTPPLEICSGQASEVCIPKCAFSLPAAVTVPTTGATTKKTPTLITWLSAIRLRPPHARMPPLDLCGFCLATWGTGCRAHRAQTDISIRGVVVLGHAGSASVQRHIVDITPRSRGAEGGQRTGHRHRLPRMRNGDLEQTALGSADKVMPSLRFPPVTQPACGAR